MFGFIRRKAQSRLLKDSGNESFNPELVKKIEDNINNFKKMLDSPTDLIIKQLTIGGHRIALINIDGLIDQKLINDSVIKKIQESMPKIEAKEFNTNQLVKHLQDEVLSTGEVKSISTLDEMSLAVLSGNTAILVDGTTEVLMISSKGWSSRGVEEPISEALVRGPRDGFTEDIRTNTVHIRRRIRDSNLRFESQKVGRRSKKDLVISYIDGIAHPQIVEEVRKRINSIDMDDVPESGFVEQWIEDNYLSPFPQMINTERPDKVSSALSQGKVAIFLDGTPFVLIAPATFGEFIQSPEDYYERWYIGSLIRSLRYLAAFCAVFLPSLYVALVSFHQGMIPSKLAFSIASTREGVPFPSLIEALFMEMTMEILREAGIRLPKPIGQTVGIVGGLVIGEAAVTAGIVSPIMVIVVSVTAIATFSIPSYSFAISLRMLRFLFLIAAGTFGFYGIILAYVGLNIHLANLKSFGVPYTVPFAPSFYKDWNDLVLRFPITFMKKRPIYMQEGDRKRQGQGGNKS